MLYCCCNSGMNHKKVLNRYITFTSVKYRPTYECVCVCVCVYIYIYIYIYVCCITIHFIPKQKEPLDLSFSVYHTQASHFMNFTV
jgi:hypothetical protein